MDERAPASQWGDVQRMAARHNIDALELDILAVADAAAFVLCRSGVADHVFDTFRVADVVKRDLRSTTVGRRDVDVPFVGESLNDILGQADVVEAVELDLLRATPDEPMVDYQPPVSL